ncbi:hypothetical protein H072_8371 [Dactylellina haptotyla CBS 200.50]|uniref:Small ribosomal subunit protein bS18m n=1 Tax=Dactylellina haptotyla (strain CBS 200.50) TaxID=1284197 RepID=S8A442_DACHA|nr:hypothetical protein H072_8371 [Dactylellina haptotyla CBS 200.50]
MPPRPSTAVVKTVLADSSFLPFLYPAASRRLLSSTAALQQGNPANQQTFLNLVKGLPKAEQSSSLPSIDSDSAPKSFRSFVNMQQRQRGKAFNDLAHMNSGTGVIVKELTSLVGRRQGIEQSLEKVDPEIFRHSPPIMERSYLNPKDLSYEEYLKYNDSKRQHLREDVFATLQESPLDHYKNFNLLKDYMTSAGRIKHRSLTNLSNRNQRKLAKAIRRAIGIGLLPSVYRHPSILMSEQKFAVDGFKTGAYQDRPRDDPVRNR